MAGCGPRLGEAMAVAVAVARDEEEPGRIAPLPPNVAFELRRHIKNHGTWGPDVLRQHYHYIFEGAGQRGRAAIATMLTPGADDPTERSAVA
ncbi:hypothetical protein [Streptomyces sp. NPDC002537]